jgi:hypothetical protein
MTKQSSIKNLSNEQQLEQVAKKLLAMPHKARVESKIGKRTAKAKASPKRKKKPSR